MVQAGIFAIDAVGMADVSDPGPVRNLQAPLSGLTAYAGERHPLLQARFTRAAQVDVQRPGHIAQHDHAAPPERHASRDAHAGEEFLDVGPQPAL